MRLLSNGLLTCLRLDWRAKPIVPQGSVFSVENNVQGFCRRFGCNCCHRQMKGSNDRSYWDTVFAGIIYIHSGVVFLQSYFFYEMMICISSERKGRVKSWSSRFILIFSSPAIQREATRNLKARIFSLHNATTPFVHNA